MKNNTEYNWLASKIYNFALRESERNSLFSRYINRLFYLLQCGITSDIPVKSLLNDQPFLCPFSHQLLFIEKKFPMYDRQLSRLCSYMYETFQRPLNIIDVGANIGDSVLNIGIRDSFYLCIEGNESFSKYITSNLKDYNYAIENCFLSDKNEEIAYSVSSSRGTGHLIKVDNQVSNTKLITLDKVIEDKYPKIEFDLLKIDTDGFDFKVIRGAKKTLQLHHPLLFFEWDKVCLNEQREDCLSIFPLLCDYGYSYCVLFDNFGNFVSKVVTTDNNTLHYFIERTHSKGLPYYYDVLAVPETGKYVFDQLIKLFDSNL